MGDREFDIVPGLPEQSILIYRLESTAPKAMMPQIGRAVVHEEGVALIREWIASLNPQSCGLPELRPNEIRSLEVMASSLRSLNSAGGLPQVIPVFPQAADWMHT